MANSKQKNAEQKGQASVQPAKCHVCGKSDHRENAKYCMKCGTKLSTPE